MALTTVNPESLAKPRGYSHGMKGRGDVLFVAGQIGWDRGAVLVSADLATQFGQALDNVLDVVWAAGGSAESVARMVLYVTDKEEYRSRSKDLGAEYRRRMGRHYPAMTLVEVKGLVDEGAVVEIEGTATIGGR